MIVHKELTDDKITHLVIIHSDRRFLFESSVAQNALRIVVAFTNCASKARAHTSKLRSCDEFMGHVVMYVYLC